MAVKEHPLQEKGSMKTGFLFENYMWPGSKNYLL